MNTANKFWKFSTSEAGIVFVAIGISGVLAATQWHYTTDDTYIYAQFAKNIIAGHGMSFNAGEPTYGFTSPLWLFSIVGMGLAGFDLITGAKILGLIFTLAATGIIYPLARKFFAARTTAIALTMAWAVNAWELRWAASGLETPMVVFLILAGLFIYQEEKKSLQFRYAGIIVGLASISRPELILLLPLAALDCFLSRQRELLVNFFRLTTPAVCVVFAWWVIAEFAFKTILPNTALVKAGFDYSPSEWLYTIVRIGSIISATNIVEGLLFCASLFFLVRQRFKKQTILLYLWVPALVCIYAVTDAEVHSRYLLAIIPVMMLLGWKALEDIAVRYKRYILILSLVTVAVIAQNQYVYWRILAPHTRTFMIAMDETLIPIAYWVKENTPVDAEIVAPDIGALAYFSDRKILDLHGLVTPAMRRFSDSTLDQKDDSRLYLYAGKPDYIIDRRLSAIETLPVYSSPPGCIPLKKWDAPPLDILEDNEGTYYTIYKLHY